ncbi:MAG: ribonuclease H-like domain-containing protein, partial [Clostridia bacterium]|nr:ribonuclease H-like domain-containing protein [Clostridia bacterium]
MAPEIVFFDLETQFAFDEVGGRQYIDRLRLSVGVIYSTREHCFRAFQEREADALIERLCAADAVVGYNCLHFDYAVLAAYGAPDLAQRVRTVDILEEITRVLGFRVKLDSVARATLGVGKTADGLQAVRWFREGRLDLVTGYCQADVDVTRRLFEYGLRHGRLWYYDKLGNKRQVPVWWGRG